MKVETVLYTHLVPHGSVMGRRIWLLLCAYSVGYTDERLGPCKRYHSLMGCTWLLASEQVHFAQNVEQEKSMNLCDLDNATKNRIELDKQAAYIVWQMKQGKAGNEAIHAQLAKINNDEEQAFFRDAIEKYQAKMTA